MTTATARRSAPKKSAPATAAAIAIPTLAKGEIYLGAIVGPEGNGEHCILLAGDKDKVTWDDAVAWAQAQGGALPNRHELLLAYEYQKKEFKRDWYWSNTQYAGYPEYAWSQNFALGFQDYWPKSNKYRARAVRRVPIR